MSSLPLDCTLAVESVKKTGALLVAEECAEQGGVVASGLWAALEEAGVPARTALVNCGAGYVPP